LLALALPLCALLGTPLNAQTAYKYRDASGQWIFTDGATGTAAPVAGSISLTHEPGAVRIAVERVDTADATRLTAANSCLCIATVSVTIVRSELAGIPPGTTYQATLQPGSRETMVEARRTSGDQPGLQYSTSAALGSPMAVHSPARPYRAPFAVGTSFRISQAYPTRITHVTPDSAYAVDFELPDGTPIYAAREGTVINVHHDSFRGAAVPAMMDQANVIEILHDDGTIAVYAHLHWDSIRVHIGQHVALGEYIADSGNTGFTTGPHLHFAVWRNAGSADVSVPVQFAGANLLPITAVTAATMTAY
jgi:murein DD-endopeptidase MepM/ murein hydrolase activator NlpD